MPASPRPSPSPVGGSLDRVNEGFHDAYDQAKKSAELGVPVLIVLGDELVLHRQGEREARAFTPAAFHALKSASHGPVALYAALHPASGRPFDEGVRARVQRLREAVASSLSSIDEALSGAGCLGELRGALTLTVELADRALALGCCPMETLERLAEETGPVLRRSIDEATRLQLEGLNEEVRAVLARLPLAERASLQVVVAGDHQARVRSFAMQYFERLLGEPAGAELRVTYGEGVSDEKAALALVGTRRLDRDVARAFFGDPSRLQRDLLGDAARDHLKAMDLPEL